MLFPKSRTVIIDDCPIQVMINSKLVKNHQFLELDKVFVNSIEGLNYLLKNSVDFLILDLDMPNINGLEILEKIAGTCKILVFSGNIERKEEALMLGADEFLCKTASWENFHNCVTKILATQEKAA